MTELGAVLDTNQIDKVELCNAMQAARDKAAAKLLDAQARAAEAEARAKEAANQTEMLQAMMTLLQQQRGAAQDQVAP